MANVTLYGSSAYYELNHYESGDEFSVFSSCHVVPTIQGRQNWYYRYCVQINGGTQYASMERIASEYSYLQCGGTGVSKTKSTQTVSVNVEVQTKQYFSYQWQTDATYSGTITIPPKYSYTVSYNANGGTNTPSSQTKWYGEGLTLSSATPTRSGYTFNSWNTSSDGSGTSYSPGSTYTSNSSQTLYAIWNPQIAFSANGGSGAPATVTKTYNSAATIPSSVPTKPGYVFTSWNTQMYGGGTSYSPGGTIPAEMNSAITLYAQYDMITAPPTISSITVIRCNSSGVANDTGAYAKVTATWTVDRTYDVSNSGYITGKYKASDASGYTSFSFTSGTTAGTGGTATAIVSGMDTDKQYEFVATVHDSCDEVGHTDTTTRAVILTRARFLMDFRSGGNAMGIGSAAPQYGLEVGFDAQFDEDVTVLGDLVAANLQAATNSGTDVASATGTFSVSSAYGKRYGPARMVGVTFTSSTSLTAGATQTLGTLASTYRPPVGMGFANAYGFGFVDSGGTVYFTPYVGMSSGTGISVTLTFINVGM